MHTTQGLIQNTQKTAGSIYDAIYSGQMESTSKRTGMHNKRQREVMYKRDGTPCTITLCRPDMNGNPANLIGSLPIDSLIDHQLKNQSKVALIP